MKILVNTPRLIPHGGVSNHYLGLKDYWTDKVLYNPIGKKSNRQGSGKYRLPINIVVFIYKLLTFKPDVVLLNPSLSKSAVVRDMIFLRIAKMFGFKPEAFFEVAEEEKETLRGTMTVLARVIDESIYRSVMKSGLDKDLYLSSLERIWYSYEEGDLEKAKEDLSPFELKVLHLFLEGYSYIEISEKLSKPAKTCDNALQRIRKKLAE